jgi:CubicO group peptidase (beta-lactamase class C family)
MDTMPPDGALSKDRVTKVKRSATTLDAPMPDSAVTDASDPDERVSPKSIRTAPACRPAPRRPDPPVSAAAGSTWGQPFRLAAVGGLVVVLLAVVHLGRQIMLVGNGYVSKTVCSGVFVTGRKVQSVLDAEIRANDPGILRIVYVEVDRTAGTVRSRFLGLGERVAIFREGLGCTLAVGVDPRALASHGLPIPAAMPATVRGPWPPRAAASDSTPGLRPAAVSAALEEAFAEPGPSPSRRTHAIVILHDGRVVAERYAPGYGPESPLPGWSMTKSVINALVGVLVREGRLALDEPLRVPEWSASDDGRRAITLRQLLQMSDGLRFSESYDNPLGDVLWMLFGTRDAGAFAASKPLIAPPGTVWSYSSGTTNIIARALRHAIGGGEEDYLLFPRRAIFEPLGMASAIIEPDAAGNYVGSSLMFATARDWARFGLLYLQDGVWEGKRILPEGWVAFSTTPAPAAPRGVYGAHFWLRLGRSTYAPSGDDGLPADAYHAVGHEGQLLTIIPSRRLVVVRLGLSVGHGSWDHAAFLRRLLQPA